MIVFPYKENLDEPLTAEEAEEWRKSMIIAHEWFSNSMRKDKEYEVLSQLIGEDAAFEKVYGIIDGSDNTAINDQDESNK